MGKSSGGGYDTGAMEEATLKSLELQKQIYDQTRADSQPWYQAGVGGVNKLADLLGVSGGSVQTRDQLYNQLAPQYTTTTSQGNPNQYVDNSGQVVTIADPAAYFKGYGNGGEASDPRQQAQFQAQIGNYDKAFQLAGYSPYSTSSTSTDTQALNQAIEERLGSQVLPEGYGSLLDRFSLQDFEADPSYQFRLEEGQKALERQMAAQGDTYSPRAAKALAEYNQGMASQEYGNSYNRYVNDQTNVYNRLAGIAGMGQTSTGLMADAGQNYAQSATQLNTSLANAQTAAAQAQASQPSMFSQVLGVGATALGGYLSGGTSLLGGVLR